MPNFFIDPPPNFPIKAASCLWEFFLNKKGDSSPKKNKKNFEIYLFSRYMSAD